MKCTTQKKRKLETRIAVDGPYTGEDIPFYECEGKTIVFTVKGQRGRYLARGGAVWQSL